MVRNWYIGRNKQKVGPFSTTQLQQLTALGLLQSTEYVLEEGARQWVALASLPGVGAAAGAPKKYWLFLEGKNHGPYPAEQVRVGLLRRQVAGETLACVEGGQEWAPLAQLAEFRACVPPARPSGHAQLGLGSSQLDLTAEEAELHLAGKQGDTMARLLSTLLDMQRRYQDNPSLAEVLGRNIQDLKAMRDRGIPDGNSARPGPAPGGQRSGSVPRAGR